MKETGIEELPDICADIVSQTSVSHVARMTGKSRAAIRNALTHDPENLFKYFALRKAILESAGKTIKVIRLEIAPINKNN